MSIQSVVERDREREVKARIREFHLKRTFVGVHKQSKWSRIKSWILRRMS